MTTRLYTGLTPERYYKEYTIPTKLGLSVKVRVHHKIQYGPNHGHIVKGDVLMDIKEAKAWISWWGKLKLAIFAPELGKKLNKHLKGE